MKYNTLILIPALAVLMGCSPFAGNSPLTNLKNSIESLYGGRSTMEVVAGGTNVLETNPGVPSQNYKVSTTIGQFINQTSYQTSGGYTVQSVNLSQ